jgi:glycosyltransferase involved in cell wall biosynthesis
MIASVAMITYGHSKFLKQAIESVLMQQTTFDFELVISNDCSPDNTDEIIYDIINSNPNGYKIKYFSHKKNLGMMPNFIFLLEQCSGKYIALCEGDDYWTDPLKLQKQVLFLEDNKDFSICFHNVNTLNGTLFCEENTRKNIASVTTIYDLATYNYINTPSVVYRNGLIPKFPAYFSKTPIGDYFLHMLNAQYGKIKYIDEVMAVYRLHDTSYWSSKDKLDKLKIWIDFIQKIKENFDTDIQMILDQQILKRSKMFQAKKTFLGKTLLKIGLDFKYIK